METESGENCDLEELVENEVESNKENVKILRVNLKSEKEAELWIQKYKEETFTCWIVDRVKKEEKCTRMVARKTWVCHFNIKNKKDDSSRRCTNCKASIDIKIKKVNKDTKKNDIYLKQNPPLQAVITMYTTHNHNVFSFDAMKYLRATKETRETFRSYFEDGHGVAASIRLHEAKLEIEEDSAIQIGNAAINPNMTTVQHWYRLWRELNYGNDIDPLAKLEERKGLFQKNGTYLNIARSSNNTSIWGVIVITPIMARMQQSIDATGLVFIDSTSSCDATECSVTTLLVATNAGAIPIAVTFHNSQSTEGYQLVFGLLKKQNSRCFGGNSVPESFMTDNSAAEKEALRIVWPDATQLLCHFHVAQAEWGWLQKAKNGISSDDRKPLMRAFQKIMYAKDAETFEAAKENFEKTCSYSNYTKRVNGELEKAEEWVLMFREWLLTRGHNTNNFSEANVRIFKDIVLERTKALNPVALADFTINVWELYFRNKLLKFAYNRKRGPYLTYDKLVKKLPVEWMEKVTRPDENIFIVPSQTNAEESYEVQADIGVCSCYAGRQGAFCKHQALVHRCFPNAGLFPNAPAVTCDDRYKLGLLALGDKCPPKDFFKSLQEDMASQEMSSRADGNIFRRNTCIADGEGMDTSEIIESETTSTSETEQTNKEIDMKPLEDLQEEIKRLYMLSGPGDFAVKQITKATQKLTKFRNEGQATKAFQSLCAAVSGVVSTKKRKGNIRVQPTSLARRKEGRPRGSKRLAAGRPRGTDPPNRAKKPHSLAQNVAANVTSAKCH